MSIVAMVALSSVVANSLLEYACLLFSELHLAGTIHDVAPRAQPFNFIGKAAVACLTII